MNVTTVCSLPMIVAQQGTFGSVTFKGAPLLLEVSSESAPEVKLSVGVLENVDFYLQTYGVCLSEENKEEFQWGIGAWSICTEKDFEEQYFGAGAPNEWETDARAIVGIVNGAEKDESLTVVSYTVDGTDFNWIVLSRADLAELLSFSERRKDEE